MAMAVPDGGWWQGWELLLARGYSAGEDDPVLVGGAIAALLAEHTAMLQCFPTSVFRHYSLWKCQGVRLHLGLGWAGSSACGSSAETAAV